MLYPDADFPDLVEDIKKDPWVKDANPIIEAPIESTTRMVPKDFLFPEQWDFEIIQLPEAWFALSGAGANVQFGSSNIILAVADRQGPEMGHPDLAGNVNGVTKAVTSFDFANFTVGYVLTGTHGTRCAGAATAAANRSAPSNANFTEGLTGSAPGCRLIGAQIAGGPSFGDFDEMFRWYSGFTTFNTAQLASPVVVCSNSYRSASGPPIDRVFDLMLQVASDFGRLGRGIAIFYSTGNDDATISGNQEFALSNRVMAIASTTLLTGGTTEARAPYSNFGQEAAFCSPSNSQQFLPTLHAPPNNWGAHTPTVTNAVAAPGGFADGNMPAAPALNAGAPIQQPLNAPTAAGSPTLITTANTTPFAGASAVMVGTPGTLNAEGLQLTGIAAAANQLNVRYSAGPPAPVPNTQQSHLGAVPIVGGAADYCSDFGGTSYSTPVVAGIAALILTARRTLSWVEVREILRTTARKVNVGEINPAGLWRDAALNTVLDAAGTNVQPKAPPVSATLAANAVAPSNARRHLNHGQSTLNLSNAAGFEIGDAIRLTDGVNTDFHVVEGKSGNTITIDALRRNYGTAPATTVTAGGVKPVRSDFYGSRPGQRTAGGPGRARVQPRRSGSDDPQPSRGHRDSPTSIWRSRRSTARTSGCATRPIRRCRRPRTINRARTRTRSPATTASSTRASRTSGSASPISTPGSISTSRPSDHQPPPVDPVVNPAGIVTPFLFPGDPGNAAAGISPRSWCDHPANDIAAGPGISSGALNVYHVRDTAAANQFNQLIPAGSVSAADPTNINTGVTVVRAQWNLADLPPAGTLHAIYLLVYVSPVDGRREGREAGRHNNMSFREIAFADFDLFDDGRSGPAALVGRRRRGRHAEDDAVPDSRHADDRVVHDRARADRDHAHERQRLDRPRDLPSRRRRLAAARSGRRGGHLGAPDRARPHRNGARPRPAQQTGHHVRRRLRVRDCSTRRSRSGPSSTRREPAPYWSRSPRNRSTCR